eukprot:CAMPEP_0172754840 /NCGR_PEP_ID=MMETSP1074-20121228/158753_1 /TAXON_ID=2916 /ORGANISM="Ceratium fusus, Strain PA161109" /LENGTH=62 /DNA_ID=CAMNT_0013587843 /DNA_START=42 /DNA_END=228 /DNA_ORIENTATION=-
MKASMLAKQRGAVARRNGTYVKIITQAEPSLSKLEKHVPILGDCPLHHRETSSMRDAWQRQG